MLHLPRRSFKKWQATVALLLAMALVPGAFAQGLARPAIDSVRVGFPATVDRGEKFDEFGRSHLFKAGAWAPVYVDLKEIPNPLTGGKIQVQTTDSDDIANVFSVDLNERTTTSRDGNLEAIAYTKPGSLRADLTVRLLTPAGNSETTRSFTAIGPNDLLCLSVGGRLPGLKQALAAPFQSDPGAMQLGRPRAAHIENTRDMPTQWFGYSSVDLLILSTSDRAFVESLVADKTSRIAALTEWVRRGGRVVVSIGRNRDLADVLFRQLSIFLPMEIVGPLPTDSLETLRRWAPGQTPSFHTEQLIDSGAKVRVTAAASVDYLLPPRTDEAAPPLVLRWGHGLGQVTLVALDLDEPPISTWPGQADFWKVLLSKCGVRPSIQAASAASSDPIADNDLTTRLLRQLDHFPGVAVMSFGWVAVLILLYILVIGPLEYLILKRLGRLEWTWITFPLIVLGVSGAAYYSATVMKGRGLHINKVDLVDVDARANWCAGTTWFSIYSPAIDNYTIGIEPAAPNWRRKEAAHDASGVVVTWQGRPEPGFGGFHRPRSQGFLQQAYTYAHDAEALVGVPIPVRSSKAFTASWAGSLAPSERGTHLYKRKSQPGIDGTLTNFLPVLLEDAALIYGENENQVKAYLLGTMTPGTPVPLSTVKDVPLSQWITTGKRDTAELAEYELIRRMMFFDTYPNPDGVRSLAYRSLDLSWRRTLRDSAMLIGRAARVQGPADEVALHPASPCRLWLGEVPAPAATRPLIDGSIVQDTIVRVLLPVSVREADPANSK
jgi:hypothetical protein